MAKRVMTAMSKLPDVGCAACHGMGSIHLTAHFYSGDTEFEAPCWECFGNDVSLSLPKPRSTDNA